MPNNDEKALLLLEKAVMKAKISIEKNFSFRPFLMLLDTDGKIKTIENRAYTNEESYTLLEASFKGRVNEANIDIALLATGDMMPSRYTKEKPIPAIRLHIEEKSQLQKQISARFIYVPYSLHRFKGSEEVFAEIGTPIPVGFPAEYLQK